MRITETLEKIKEYEHFVENTLKNDLREIEKCVNEKVVQYKDWEEVKQMTDILKEFKQKDRDMLVKVDIGDGIMVNGEISDYEQTFVNVGLGIILELNCEETLKYSDIRLRLLKKEIDHLRKLAVDVKVHIKMTLLAINELQKSILTSEKTKNSS